MPTRPPIKLKPLDAPPKLPPWPGILPSEMESLGSTFADNLRIDPAPVMASMLTAVTAVLAGRVWVAPDRDDDFWVEPVALWTVNVAPVSFGKTPILKLSLGPIAEIEEALRQEYRVEKANYDLLIAKLKKEDPRPPQPVQRRLLIQDATKEALGRLLVDNPGLLSYYDELTGLFSTWRQKGREADRSFSYRPTVQAR